MFFKFIHKLIDGLLYILKTRAKFHLYIRFFQPKISKNRLFKSRKETKSFILSPSVINDLLPKSTSEFQICLFKLSRIVTIYYLFFILPIKITCIWLQIFAFSRKIVHYYYYYYFNFKVDLNEELFPVKKWEWNHPEKGKYIVQ